jgi:hypothetical protein
MDEFWRDRLPDSREGTCWRHVLETLTVYRLIDPGSEWRLHRQWFQNSAMADLLEEDFSLAEKNALYRCLDKVLEHRPGLVRYLRRPTLVDAVLMPFHYSGMEIPLFKDFKANMPIDIETPLGIVPVYVFKWERGSGSKKWVLSIDGFCRQKVEQGSQWQCYIAVKSGKLGCWFDEVEEVDDPPRQRKLWRVKLRLLISNPDFW